MPVIEVVDVRKSYGPVQALGGISFSVDKGEVFGLIGPNGAGKSTMFRLLLGLIRPDAGRIVIQGEDVSSGWSRKISAGIGYLPENVVFYDHMSGRETLRFLARIKKAPRERVEALLQRVGLAADADRKVGTYSKGMRQRLGLAQALLSRPQILFLDESTSGLDPKGIDEFYAILEEARQAGTTILLTSHILKEIQDRVDRLAIIRGGSLIACGTLTELGQSLGLQPTMTLRTRDHSEALESALAEAGARDVTVTKGMVRFQFDPQHKMQILQALVKHQSLIVDFDIDKPSLNDVFMGFAGAEEG